MEKFGLLKFERSNDEERKKIMELERKKITNINQIMADYASSLKLFYVSMAATIAATMAGAASILSRPYTIFRRN